MKHNKLNRKGAVIMLILMFTAGFAFKLAGKDTGVLILAHGGNDKWNNAVKEAAAPLKDHYEVTVAFGMAKPKTIRAGIRELESRGVSQIVAVPLFISSHSPIIPQTAYLLGLREERPGNLMVMKPYKKYASLFRKVGKYPVIKNYIVHERPEPEKLGCLLESFVKEQNEIDKILTLYEGFLKTYRESLEEIRPVEIRPEIFMARPLDDHPLVAEILWEHAGELSNDPANETLVIVAHGPNSEVMNKKWINTMESLAGQIREIQKEKGKAAYKQVFCLTVRDDAPKPIYDQARENLRNLVHQSGKNGVVVVVPLLLSQGGIEQGIKKRMEGLNYKWTGKTLLPHSAISAFLQMSVKKSLE